MEGRSARERHATHWIQCVVAFEPMRVPATISQMENRDVSSRLQGLDGCRCTDARVRGGPPPLIEGAIGAFAAAFGVRAVLGLE